MSFLTLPRLTLPRLTRKGLPAIVAEELYGCSSKGNTEAEQCHQGQAVSVC
jgi:hypothetical protein